jgi:predicted transcriptional regulator
MGKTVENPKKNIVSCRVDDDEMQVLQAMAKRADLSISMLLRHSIEMLQENFPPEMRLSA